LKKGSMVAGAIAAEAALRKANAMPYALERPLAAAPATPVMDAATRELILEALKASKMAGADYADVRIGRYRANFVQTREQQIVNVADTDSMGCGVRALVDGTWGFAATRTLTKDGIATAAKKAVAVAKATRLGRDRAVQLAPAPSNKDVAWQNAFTIDPWTIPIEQKADLLLKANTNATKDTNVKYVFSAMFFRKEERNYANTDGSVITQTIIDSWVPMQITAVAPDASDFQNRASVSQRMGRGYEYVLAQDIVGNATRWGEEASAKLKAKPVDVGRYDLVLHPSHLWLTIHESIGHPTELDRAMGYEANYAGTSFVSPPEKVLGKLKYGP